MNKHIVTKLITLVFSIYLHNAQALPFLSVQTLDTTVGSSFDAKILIDSVTDFAGFEFELTFDSTKLSAQSIVSGNIFDADTDPLESSINPGSVKFAEALSATVTPGLDINLPTLLATIRFKALDTGVNSFLDIINPILSDSSGDSIRGSKQGAFVTISAAPEPPVAVPEPTVLFLFIIGLLALKSSKRKGQTILSTV